MCSTAYVQAAQPVPNTKVQASSMTAKYNIDNLPITGGLCTGPWDMSLECDIVDRNVTCVWNLLLGSHYHHLGYCDMFQ